MNACGYFIAVFGYFSFNYLKSKILYCETVQGLLSFAVFPKFLLKLYQAILSYRPIIYEAGKGSAIIGELFYKLI